MALCFRGHPGTILIGEPTYGVSTGLRGFFMPDSTQFAVTHTVMTDRNQVGDGGSILPEILADDPIESFEHAYKWIHETTNEAVIQ